MKGCMRSCSADARFCGSGASALLRKWRSSSEPKVDLRANSKRRSLFTDGGPRGPLRTIAARRRDRAPPADDPRRGRGVAAIISKDDAFSQRSYSLEGRVEAKARTARPAERGRGRLLPGDDKEERAHRGLVHVRRRAVHQLDARDAQRPDVDFTVVPVFKKRAARSRHPSVDRKKTPSISNASAQTWASSRRTCFGRRRVRSSPIELRRHPERRADDGRATRRDRARRSSKPRREAEVREFHGPVRRD